MGCLSWVLSLDLDFALIIGVLYTSVMLDCVNHNDIKMVHAMAANALTPCITRSSAAIAVTM